jgi:ketosteroid isomerase-like protein
MLRLVVVVTIGAVLLAASRDQAVLAAERAWLDAYNHRDAATVAHIEDDGFLITFGDGRTQDKAAQLEALRRPIPRGAAYEIHTESTSVRVYGTTAILTGIVIESGQADGQSFSSRSRYTDTWIERGGRWYVVASHLSDLK